MENQYNLALLTKEHTYTSHTQKGSLFFIFIKRNFFFFASSPPFFFYFSITKNMSSELDFETYLGMRTNNNNDNNHHDRHPSASPNSFTSPQLSLGSLDQSATSSSTIGPAVSTSDFSLDDLEHMFDWGDLSQQRQQQQQQQPQSQQQHPSPTSSNEHIFLSDFSPSSSGTLSPPTDLLHHHQIPEDFSTTTATSAGQNNTTSSIQAEARKAFVGGYFPAFNETPCFVESFSTLGGPMPGIAIPATPIPEGPTSLSPSSSSGSSATHASWPVLDQWYRAAAATAAIPPPSQQQQHPSTTASALTPPPESTHSPPIPSIKVENISTNNNNATTPPMEPAKNWRKRTNSDISDVELNQHLWRLEPNQQIKKVAHNAIERRYRNNINDRIQDLKNVVPALYKAKIKEKGGPDDDDSDDDMNATTGEQPEGEIVEGVEVAKKLNKATILRKATEYIMFLRQSNDVADRENQILQHIISQMPGGQHVLTQFLSEKRQFEQAEQERVARERKEAHAREQVQRQELLRERAAQRAALAQLMPKRERRPYRRRKKQDTGSTKKSAANAVNGNEQDNSRMFMAMYMCVAFFSTSPFGSPATTTTTTTSSIPHHHASRVAFQNTTMSSNNLDMSATASVSWDSWFWFKMMLYAVGIFYFVVIPLINRYLQPRPVAHVNKQKKINDEEEDCSNHHHYAAEVSSSWHQLYEALVTLVPSPAFGQPTQLLSGILSDLMVFAPFSKTWIKLFKGSHVGSIELSNAGAWVRLSELQCLGGDSTVSKLERIRSCTGMLASIHAMERDSRRTVLLRPRTLARVYTTAAIQTELILGNKNNRLSQSYWKRAIEKSQYSHGDGTGDIQEKWLQSKSYEQLMHMMAARTGHCHDNNASCCPSMFYSFVLPYLTAPLDWVIYWQTLQQFQRAYVRFIERAATVMNAENDDKEKKEIIFEVSQLPESNDSPIDHMTSWWTHLGMALESNHTQDFDQLELALDGSMLLKRHCRSLSHLVKATTTMAATTTSSNNNKKILQELELALTDPLASIDAIRYIANHDTNDEAILLSLSALATHLTAYHTLSSYCQSLDEDDLLPKYLKQLQEHIRIDLELLESSKLVSTSCRKQIQANYISL
ncbi:hypothetical protein BDA99DRAFT_513040 [Phascolomyces articulosus]|uniref:BHLH domain-containing protein n=1 Tax=Phascolomyces articulosus TaxID=60185 RepID=A0AAD5K898_9FUNG|nr:hypothetical protein BDA99DRAFT_513040 [Phascolomyces articulosus]